MVSEIELLKEIIVSNVFVFWWPNEYETNLLYQFAFQEEKNEHERTDPAIRFKNGISY